ncbi:MAG: hypothetical protein KDI30_10685 [Pseudomonadales bacterium]|nr:hypothetical protein [Pseudomonadales bacterium]
MAMSQDPYAVYPDFEGYLKKSELLDGALYAIFARNAFIGMWHQQEDAFFIARLKGGGWRLDTETHWDDEYYHQNELANRGTAKPLWRIDTEIPEFCKAVLQGDTRLVRRLSSWLLRQEINHPLSPGFKSIERKIAADRHWMKRIAQKKRTPRNEPVYKSLLRTK